jgi:hypothetical protein
MKKLLLALLVLGVHATAFAQNADVLLTWEQPTEREDGTVLNVSEITGYILQKTDGSEPIEVPAGYTDYAITVISYGRHCWTLKTVAGDMVSKDSLEGCTDYIEPLPPAPLSPPKAPTFTVKLM